MILTNADMLKNKHLFVAISANTGDKLEQMHISQIKNMCVCMYVQIICSEVQFFNKLLLIDSLIH